MAARRRSTRNRKKDNGKGRWVALGVAGALSLGWLSSRGPSDDAVALSATAEGEQAEAESEGEAPRQAAKGAPPRALTKSLRATGNKSLHQVLDLRRLALEFAGTSEGKQAAEALEAEVARQERAAAEAQDPTAGARAKSLAYLATLDSDARRDKREAVQEQTRAAINHPKCSFVRSYTVKSGDVLARIARRHKTDYRLIKRLSGMTRDFLKVGQKLKLPHGKSEVVIFKSQFELMVLLDGCMLRAFDVATGKNGRTPEGRFTIGTKQVNPTWYSPEGKVFPYGSEGNVLGTRWLAFVDTDQYKGFGIHGTKFPESIGTEASMGCLRLRNPDAEYAYDLIPSKTTVRILK